jgi:GT2 family glycosyltransferase/spore maturation protein CgeB
MTPEIEAAIENFDGIDITGWIRFGDDVKGWLFHVEVPEFGKRNIDKILRRPDLEKLKTGKVGEFRIGLDDFFPGIVEYATNGPPGQFCVSIKAVSEEGAEKIFFEFVGSWALLEAAASSRQRSDGRIDTIDEKWISGWAFNLDRTPLQLEVLVDDVVVAAGITGLYRGDVARSKPLGIHSGFVMPTPAILCDGFLHKVSIRTADPAWIFPGFPRQLRLGKVVGTVEKIQANSVEGWFGFSRKPDTGVVSLTVRCNGEPIGSTALRVARNDVVVAGLAAEAFSFHFQTKRGIFAEDVVTVTCDALNYELKVIDNAKPAGLPSAISGHLDRADDLEIIGWAIDRRSPAEVLRVIVFADGVPVTEAVTEGFRADVQRLFPQAMRPGFVIRTPASLRDSKHHRLELRVVGSDRLLSGTPCDIKFSRKPVVYHNLNSSTLAVLREKSDGFADLKVNEEKNNRGSGVSHIILNKNGSTVFVKCLESLLEFIDPNRDEVIVVDHNSTDISRDALKLLEDKNIVRVIWKQCNESFSKSNNDAAAVASKPVLLFLNNDIEFVANISRTIERHLCMADVGVVGIKLFDIVEPSDSEAGSRELRALRLQHLGVWFQPGQANNGFNLVGYDITSAATYKEMFGLHDVAVVTGAALGISARDFSAVGGFDERYFYGTEDIDLCLKVQRLGKRVICDRSLEALHVRGYTRFTRRGGGASERFAANNRRLWTKFGATLRRNHLRSAVSRDGLYGPPTFRIGLAVTEAGDNVVAGDYFTALEMARSLSGHRGVEYVFLSEKEDWYDCSSLDALVVMRHDYDLRRIRNQKSNCLLIGWVRNQFDTWLYQPWLDQFDLFLSSSRLFSGLLYRRYGIRAHTFFIATSFSIKPDAVAVDQDVVFVGSRWGGARELEAALVPEKISGTVRVFGAGFGDVPALRPAWGGVVPYAEVEGIYHRSRIVVDDANSTTKRWGSPNSRVFDAIAAGAAIITNSRATSAVLQGTLPLWADEPSLSETVNELLTDQKKLEALTEKQAAVVNGHHTYAARAEAFLEILKKHTETNLRVEILTAVPPQADANLWGDWHFAQSLAKELRRKGHAVRVRKLGERPDRATDMVLGLRGLQRFEPLVGAINILWIISHPNQVSADELGQWQHVFVASRQLSKRLAPYAASLSVLEQATEFTPACLWLPEHEKKAPPNNQGVFVGSTRGVPRAFIEKAFKTGLSFEIWGQGWDDTVLRDHVVGTSIENKRLGSLYARAAFVLSDHWPDMAKEGIVSNRVFDALAAGGVVITDPVSGIEDLRLPNLFVCQDETEIRRAAEAAVILSYEDRLKGAREVVERFSFRTCANTICTVVAKIIDGQGRSAAGATGRQSRSSAIMPTRASSKKSKIHLTTAASTTQESSLVGE